jgi:hypothetical protein
MRSIAMDAVWALAVGLITPYVTKAGEKIAEKVGETLFDALKKRFTEKKDPEGKKVLASYKRNPEVYGGSLEKYLEIRAQDQEFLAWLQEQIAIAQQFSTAGKQETGVSVHQEVKDRSVVHGSMFGVVQGNVQMGKDKSKR